MKITEVVLISSVVLVVALRLYKKYADRKKPDAITKEAGRDYLKISDKDDEYEPYAGRRK